MNETLNISHAGRSTYWYLPLLLGILFVALGVWVIFTPLESYIALAIIFAVTFLISGILEIMYAISNRHGIHNWGWSLAVGIVDLIIGVMLVTKPVISMAVLPIYVGFGILFRSVMAIGWAFELKRREVPNWGYLLALGVLGLFFAFIMILNPVFGSLTIVFYTALALISIGVFQISLSLRLKKLQRSL
ncbi:HdeD family acid-resistance protein [Pontibacter russatus]|uniref:HdeD family acid-resistance protein n=1 Tax=Pontibacter russatus TaxID=2694929 RepID=UPI001379B212|nr:DUF308 domain-containing protein [Pontibacter russatus]